MRAGQSKTHNSKRSWLHQSATCKAKAKLHLGQTRQKAETQAQVTADRTKKHAPVNAEEARKHAQVNAERKQCGIQGGQGCRGSWGRQGGRERKGLDVGAGEDATG